MNINVGDMIYYARILPYFGICDVYDLKIRTVSDNWFVGTEKKGQAFLFSGNDIGNIVFLDRDDAVYKAKKYEKYMRTSQETLYEEY